MHYLEFLDEIHCANLDYNQELIPIFIEIKEAVFKLDTEEKTKTWLQKLQTYLLNQNESNEKSDTILNHLETYFYNYINSDLAVSNIGKSRLIIQNAAIQNIKETFSLEFLKNIKHLFGENQFYTLQHAQFINKFWLNYTNDFDTETITPEAFENYLVIENFNTPLFFKYMIRKIITELQTEDNPSIQKQILLSRLSDFNQLPSNRLKYYRKDYGNIKEMIIDWLQTEIKKCNKKLKKYNPNQQPIYGQEDSKIQMNISVAQTAYLFKLMNSKGLISNKTNTDILNVLVGKFSTPKAENISYESLHNKYYNIEDKTKESVHELLKTLLKP